MGDKVLLLHPISKNSELMQWKGSYTGVSSSALLKYVVNITGEKKMISMNILKRYHEASSSSTGDHGGPDQDKDKDIEALAAAVTMILKSREEPPVLPALEYTETWKVMVIPEHLPTEDQRRIKEVLKDYDDVFSDVQGVAGVLPRCITLTDGTPVSSCP